MHPERTHGRVRTGSDAPLRRLPLDDRQEEYPSENWTLHVSATTYEESYERVHTDYVAPPAVFRDKDYLHPINAAQMAEMTNMTQNYGH